MKPPRSETPDGASWERRVLYGLIVIVTFALVFNSTDSGAAKTPLLLILGTLIAAIYLSRTLSSKTLSFPRFKGDLILWGLLFYVAILASLKRSPVYTLHAVELWVGYIICAISGAVFFATREHRQRLFTAVLWVCAGVALIGWTQFLVGDGLPLEFFNRKGEPVSSTLANPNYLAGFLVTTIPIAVTAFMVRDRSRKAGYASLVLAVALALLLFVTRSRTSVVALGIAMLVYISLARRLRFKGILALVMVMLGIALTVYVSVPSVSRNIDTLFSFERHSTLARRSYFWRSALQATADVPVFGHGPGSFESTMFHYRPPDYWTVGSEDIVPHAHNELLELLTEFGVVGTLLVLAVCGTALVRGISLARTGDKQTRLVVAGLVAALTGVLLDNLANVSLRQAPVGALTWIFAGLLLSWQLHAQRVKVPLPDRLPRALAALPFLIWAGVAYVIGGQEVRVLSSDQGVLRARYAKFSGDVTTSTSELKQAVETNPYNLPARLGLCLELLGQQRYTETLAEVRTLRGISPLYPRSALIEAWALLSLERPAEALICVKEEILVRDHPEAYHLQSIICRKLGDTQGEREALELLVKRNLVGKFEHKLEYALVTLRNLASSTKDLAQLRFLLNECASAFPKHLWIQSLLDEVNAKLTSSNGTHLRGQ